MSGTPSRVVGLDYGDKTVGVALSDPTGLIAQGIEIIRRQRANKLRRTLARIAALCEQFGAEGIVLGLPRSEDGHEGERCALTREFGEQVHQRTGLPVFYQDERYTSVAAQEVLDEAQVAAKDRKTYIDEVAAMLILQEWLDARRTE